MDSFSFWITWGVFWFANLVGLVSVYLTISEASLSKINAELDPKAYGYGIARSIFYAYSLSDKIFGKRIISVRSFLVSVLFSFVGTIIALSIAIITTPELVFRLKFMWELVQNDNIDYLYSALLSIGLLLANTIAEFAYVAKSRAILRNIRKSINIWRIALFYSLDITSTFVLFIILTPGVIIMFSFAFEFYFSGYNSDFHMMYINSGQMGTYEDLKGGFAVSGNVILLYLEVAERLVRDFIFEVKAYFTTYETMTIYVARPWNFKFGTSSCQTGDCALLFHPLTFFTTTAFASAFMTTIWISFYASAIFIGNSLCRSFDFCILPAATG